MSHLFPAERSLLFPQFETYRLRSLDADTDLSSHSLPGGGATQSRVGYGSNASHLSFKEVRARIGWDHLAVDYASGRGSYVDTDWKVVGFELDNNLNPTFTTLAELPVPISSTEQQAEFPSVLAISGTQWAVSTGSGTLYILQVTPRDQAIAGKVIARYDLPASASASTSYSLSAESDPASTSSTSSSSTELSPFLLRSLHSVSDEEVKILATRSIRSEGGKSKISTAQNTRFELLEFTIDPTRPNGVDEGEPGKLQVNWVLEGGDLPVWTSWNEGLWLVLSAEEFRAKSENTDKAETEDEKRKREKEEKVSKLGLGASLPPSEEVPKPADEAGDVNMDPDEANEYPYNWTQNAESINVNIPLPAGVSKEAIKIKLGSSSFAFSLESESPKVFAESPVFASFLSTATRAWWTNIDPSASTWTFDPSKSLIELDLAKVDENVRWPSVFSPSDEDEYDEVSETLSAATLAAVRDTFSQIKTRGPDEPEGMHPAMPALLREEMDFDLDDGEDYGDGQDGVYSELGGSGKVGRDVFIGSITSGDGAAEWSKTNTSVISLPINGSSSNHANAIIIKSAVDGLTFQPTQEPFKNPWKHISTNPALAFVISSKRDLRLVRHLTSSSSTFRETSTTEVHPHQSAEPSSPSASKRSKTITSSADGEKAQTTVLAFDSGSSSAGSGNLYVYYPAESSTGAKQGVIPISGGERGALLGVGLVRAGGKEVVIALCEKELVVLKGVL
ncbi:hypothetical protein IAT40_006454 [Kwoniella sp. CBS 6097]